MRENRERLKEIEKKLARLDPPQIVFCWDIDPEPNTDPDVKVITWSEDYETPKTT